MKQPTTIGIIGLGYVGLPLAVAFSKKYKVVGFDINATRIKNLNAGHDSTLEVSDQDLQTALTPNTSKGLVLTDKASDLAAVGFYIVTVPTPIDDNNQPDLTPLIKASETLGAILKSGDIVVYESTVYPGVTEEVCVPILEQKSGLTFNKDFFAGYSPERINPGDKKHTVTQILKVTSGSTPEVAKLIDEVYGSVIDAGTHLAPSIKVAEAAKVIENSQRDINIAFVNELSKIFRLLDIDTQAVLEAAGTKWNFLKFTPGLVGGHCIGVDPYYLAQKAMESGYNPEIILAGRRMNDSMGNYVAQEVIKLMLAKEATIKGGKALVMGITFKENCPDTRNTRVVDVIAALKEYHLEVDVFDPWAKQEQVTAEYGLTVKNNEAELASQYDCIILAVAHDAFKQIDISKLKGEKSVVFDVKSFLPETVIDGRL
ncbi:UDP-N-acetyl-D-galactosamine dehydrogenase [Gilvibacter sp. SZ-19]|jgi:UDP-N-acetyl-D-galactosamine dehydrogenase|uniref:nucleotide sugar dehydrogenase n=1 Tax=Gilvibacter sp. SZ-19 TaxID=754429 RepID=UPI000B3C52C3|nr:nucleotide sugar dehydrogenase [Gilvibacter sp. SZ-19]ARV12792.1 UDP-N-acetyl-D-galactosamine dehydrogenase [Gilvibacter sp. SZ-19]